MTDPVRLHADASAAGTPALALASTIAAEAERDRLEGPGGLARWLEEQREMLGEPGSDTALRVAEFRALREAVNQILRAASSGDPLPVQALERVNDASAAAPTWIALDAADPRHPGVVVRAAGGSRTLEILAAIARSTIELAGGPDRERLRRCPAPRCGRYFLASRRGTVWCSPTCGNRARVARHVARRREQGPGPSGTA
jgi:predicted RNA-binding Zn ribbon-like protein